MAIERNDRALRGQGLGFPIGLSCNFHNYWAQSSVYSDAWQAKPDVKVQSMEGSGTSGPQVTGGLA